MKKIPRMSPALTIALLVSLACVPRACAQDPPAAEGQPEATLPAEPPAGPDQASTEPLPPVAATVNGDLIFAAEVRAGVEIVQKSGRVRNVKPEDLSAEVLEQIIDRKLAT